MRHIRGSSLSISQCRLLRDTFSQPGLPINKMGICRQHYSPRRTTSGLGQLHLTKAPPPTSVNREALCNLTSANVASTGHVHKKPKTLQGPQYRGQDSASADACNHPTLEENGGTQDTTNIISVHQESFASTADLAER